MRNIFPFTSIVGQERMKRALILNAVYPQIGGVLIRGERGTAKSTAARALSALLPEIEVVQECRFGCDPDQPATWCTECRERAAKMDGQDLPRSKRRTQFVDLPVSATEDRVVGTLDIEQAIQKGIRRFEPGVLASANRGLLYVDEVNLLDDHVVDLLLDSAAMGVNVVEREGISFSHPARFILVGTMNPEEGDLRPQLLDRFAFAVDITGIHDQMARMQILERNLQFESDPEGFQAEWEPHEQQLSHEIDRARKLLSGVKYRQSDLAAIAGLVGGLGVDGHRADLVILKGARAHAALQGRTYITKEDILLAAELALPHRLKRQPFQEDGSISAHDLSERLEKAESEFPGGDEAELDEAGEEGATKKKTVSPEGEVKDTADFGQSDARTKTQTTGQQDAYWWEGGDQVPIGETFDVRKLDTPLDQLARRASGRRSTSKTDRKRGRYIQARPSPGDPKDLAFDATLRAAAPFQKQRKSADAHGPALRVKRNDYQKKVRVRKTSNLILFVVDASWSMAVAERMQATKGAIMSLLTDAYQRRDRVGLIVFQKDQARLVLPPTNSIDLAQRALRDIPVGGKTPLSAGLTLTHFVLQQEMRLHPDVAPLVIILTDGAGNVSQSGLPAQEESYRVCEEICKLKVRTVLINMEHPAFDQGLAQKLADHLEAPCYSLKELKAESLYRTVRDELDSGKVQ